MRIAPFKMKVEIGTNQSEIVQRIIFENNYDWHFSPEEKQVRFTEMPFLHFWTPITIYLPELFYIGKDHEDYYNLCKEKEVSFNDFVKKYSNEQLLSSKIVPV